MKYTGGCHCGKVRYEVEAEIKEALDCNCSICAKRGALLAFAIRENFKLLSSESSLTDYQFNRKVIHHLFCSSCGILSFAQAKAPDGKDMTAINVRCLDNFDLTKIKINHWNGKHS